MDADEYAGQSSQMEYVKTKNSFNALCEKIREDYPRLYQMAQEGRIDMEIMAILKAVADRQV